MFFKVQERDGGQEVIFNTDHIVALYGNVVVLDTNIPIAQITDESARELAEVLLTIGRG